MAGQSGSRAVLWAEHTQSTAVSRCVAELPQNQPQSVASDEVLYAGSVSHQPNAVTVPSDSSNDDASDSDDEFCIIAPSQ